MTLRSAAGSLALFLAPWLVLTIRSLPATAGEYLHCPKTVFCKPRCPNIKYRCVCPKPVCSCGGLENFGYYATCWQPWPFPPDYSHCPVPPPIVVAAPSRSTPSPSTPKEAPESTEQLPSPKEMSSEPSLP
ncbi:MAG TPA: hypothetical protein VH682_08765 [Gemmataceae bacterium]|jgi:hypothetical protein